MPMRSTTLIAAILLLSSVAGSVATRADAPAAAAAQPIAIQPQLKEGMRLTYRWRLSGKTAWLPAQQGTDYAAADTDFLFTLVGKTLREDGSLTMALLGQSLRASGESNKGKIGIEAGPVQAKVFVGGQWWGPSNNSPLANEITVTVGPRFEGKFGTGMQNLAIYFLPSVDPTLWLLLTTAPAEPVTPGQTWEKKFSWPLPGASSKPVDVTATWKVDAPKQYLGQRVLPIHVTARLDMADSHLLLQNGDKVHLKQAMYQADGVAYWHIEKGILCYADMQEKFNGSAVPPDLRKIGHLAKSTLELQR
jgi:hypothetical protein